MDREHMPLLDVDPSFATIRSDTSNTFLTITTVNVAPDNATANMVVAIIGEMERMQNNFFG